MNSYTLTINRQPVTVEAQADTPLLWVLRSMLKLTGTKFGCGKGLCGACTVHFNGQAIRSCQMPVSAAVGQEIITIEGLAKDGELHPVQQAWIDNDVPQCGYCQAGQIMSAAALLKNNPEIDDDTIELGMSGNICRCGTYVRIKKAIKSAAAKEQQIAITEVSNNDLA